MHTIEQFTHWMKTQQETLEAAGWKNIDLFTYLNWCDHAVMVRATVSRSYSALDASHHIEVVLDFDGTVKIKRPTDPYRVEVEDLVVTSDDYSPFFTYAVEQVETFIAGLPTEKEEEVRKVNKAVAHAVETCRAAGVEMEMLNPLEEMMKRLASNALEHHEL